MEVLIRGIVPRGEEMAMIHLIGTNPLHLKEIRKLIGIPLTTHKGMSILNPNIGVFPAEINITNDL